MILAWPGPDSLQWLRRNSATVYAGETLNSMALNMAQLATGNSSQTVQYKSFDFYWLYSLIRRLRPDLARLFPEKRNGCRKFITWLMADGTKEYAALREDQAFQDFLGRKIPGLGMTILQALLYNERKDVQKAFPLPEGQSDFIAWFFRYGVIEHELWSKLTNAEFEIVRKQHPHIAVREIQERTAQAAYLFGVNLVGYAYGQLGIGEDLRMTARALLRVGVPFTIINFPPGNDIPQNDRSIENFVGSDAPYRFNIFCMTALETGRFYAEKGPSFFNGRYNIGYWPWELSRWPDEWLDLTNLVDEVWVSSRYIYNALAPVSNVPVLIMPLAVEIGEVTALTRQDFNLPQNTYLFCFSFDLNSSIHRKNPRACLKAFHKAFPIDRPADRKVGLVIKCHKPQKTNPLWGSLKTAAAQDKRIHIIEETLSRQDLLALYKNCDCYLSLHRAEGFGRGIAETLLLGLDVIATSYSGNVDFCRDNPHAHLARYSLIPVRKGEYPYGKGQVWADPDIDHAAEIMKSLVAQKEMSVSHRKSYYIDNSYFFSVSSNYEKRLKILINN